MADAVVLYDGIIIKLSAISNSSTFDPNDDSIMFFSDGKHPGSVKRFTLGPNSYMALFDSKTKEFKGYYIEKSFWNANFIKERNSQTNATYKENVGEKFIEPPFSRATADDWVIMSYEKVFFEDNTNSLKRVTYYGKDLIANLNFSTGHSIIKYLELLKSERTISNNILKNYYNFIKTSKFLSLSDGTLYDLTEKQENILFDIINILDKINIDIVLSTTLAFFNFKAIFDFHLSLPTRFEILPNTINHNYHDTYNEEFFARLRLGLIDFLYFVKSYGPDYNDLTIDDLSVCIINIFPEQELSRLPYSFKMNLLDRIILQDNWIKGDWGFNLINEEQAIIKIIRSIACETNGVLNYNEINQFLYYLNITCDSFDKKTLFQILYERINDNLIFGDDGKGARGQFVNAVYLLWLESKYNPEHKVESIKDSALANFKYTPYNAQWQFYNNITDSKIDFDSAPAVIPYKSDKKLLWYIDNFKFLFVKDKIYAYQETDKSWGDYLKDILITITAPLLAPLAVEYVKYSLYGTYNIFQPIYVANYSQNKTIITLPLKPNSSPCDPNSIQNNYPIFYLKYIDDLGDYSDVKNAISTTIDVALTFTGVGNLAKLKHIGKLAHISKYSTLSTLEREGVKKALFGLIGSVEFLASTASIANNLITDGCTSSFPCSGTPPQEGTEAYKKYEACQTLQSWLFAFEILSVTGDLLARRHFKKIDQLLKEQKENILLLEKPNAPNDANFNANKQEMYEILSSGSLSNLEQELSSFLSQYPDISNKLDNLQLTQSEKITFMDDFVDTPSTLSSLTSNLDYIDNWKTLQRLEIVDRKQLDIIKNSGLCNAYKNYYEVPALKEVLKNLSAENRIKFLKKYGTATPLPKPNFIKAFRDLEKISGIGDNTTILNQLGDFTDDLYNKFIYELNHPKRGKDFKLRLVEEPTKVDSVVRKVLENPSFAWYNRVDPNWKKWARSQFFKYYTQTGKKFENFLSSRLIKRGVEASDEYNILKNNVALDEKNLDDYELFTSVQLKYGSGNDFFIADQLFVKYNKNSKGKNIIDDIIIFETKLQLSTPLTDAQLAARNAAMFGFDVRNIRRRSETLINGVRSQKLLVKMDLNLSFKNGNITFYKAYDTKDGNKLSGVLKINATP